MEIINNKLNSLPQQVEENMKNIILLAQYLKEAYRTDSQLTTSTSSIAISDTNAPTSVVEGWLLDSKGKLFKITGGDTINFLLVFYTDFRGEKGDTGGVVRVEANPVILGSETPLHSIGIGDDKYKINYLDDIIDKDGNSRFIEGDGVPLSATGINITYCKWSLSGTHLMFVIAGDVTSAAVLPANSTFGRFDIPQWIMDKIYPVWDNRFIELKTVHFTSNDWDEQTKDSVLNIYDGDILISNPSSVALTFNKNRGFRIQYDLLIDNE